MQGRTLIAKPGLLELAFDWSQTSLQGVGTGILTGRDGSSSQRTQTASQIPTLQQVVPTKLPQFLAYHKCCTICPKHQPFVSTLYITGLFHRSRSPNSLNIISTLRGQQKAKSMYTSRQPGREFKALPRLLPSYLTLSHSPPFSSAVESLLPHCCPTTQTRAAADSSQRQGPGRDTDKALIPLVERSGEMVTFPTLVSALL